MASFSSAPSSLAPSTDHDSRNPLGTPKNDPGATRTPDSRAPRSITSVRSRPRASTAKPKSPSRGALHARCARAATHASTRVRFPTGARARDPQARADDRKRRPRAHPRRGGRAPCSTPARPPLARSRWEARGPSRRGAHRRRRPWSSSTRRRRSAQAGARSLPSGRERRTSRRTTSTPRSTRTCAPCSSATRATATISSSDARVPPGLCKFVSATTRVRGVIAARTRSGSSAKRSPAGRSNRVTRAPRPSAMRYMGSYVGRSTSASSPGERSAAYAVKSACDVPSAGSASLGGTPLCSAIRSRSRAHAPPSSNRGALRASRLELAPSRSSRDPSPPDRRIAPPSAGTPSPQTSALSLQGERCLAQDVPRGQREAHRPGNPVPLLGRHRRPREPARRIARHERSGERLGGELPCDA